MVWPNLSAASLLAHDGGACAARPGLIAERVDRRELSQSMRLIHGVGGWEKLSTRGAMWNKRRGKMPMWCDVWSAKCEVRNAKCDASLFPSPAVLLSLLLLFTRSPARLGTLLFFSSVGALTLSSASFSAPMVPPTLHLCGGRVYHVSAPRWLTTHQSSWLVEREAHIRSSPGKGVIVAPSSSLDG